MTVAPARIAADSAAIQPAASGAAAADDVVLSLQGIGKAYYLYDRPRDRLKQLVLGRWGRNYGQEFWALREVSLELRRGQTLGVIGRNGSGKSTLLQIISGVLQPTRGTVRVKGRVAAMLELGSGFNPEYSGRENVLLNGAILGIGRADIEKRYEQIVAFADIGDFIRRPVKTYSTGMYMRLAFAVATSVNPDLLLIDEVLAVGDVFFRQKCYRRLDALRESGTAIVLVSHAMTEVEQFCRRGLLLHYGDVLMEGSAVEVVKRYYLIEQEDRAAAVVPPSGDAPLAAASPHPDDQQAARQHLWPDASKALDISHATVIDNGWAKCTGLWLCNAAGEPAQVFQQSETAVFYTEFELLRDIEVPIGGVVITNDKGATVHGKSTLEYGSYVPRLIKAGTRVRFRQEIMLDVAIGEYTFEVGLATMSAQDYDRRAQMPHIELHGTNIRLCHLPDVNRLAVIFRRNPWPVQLLHHGIANLPGHCEVSLFTPQHAAPPAKAPREPDAATDAPPIFHVTHWKAGSQWIYKILAACAPERIVPPQLGNLHVFAGTHAGKIYPTVYMARDEFLRILPKNGRYFVVIRDLRDTLVSAYFSFKHTHKLLRDDMAQWRQVLNSVDQEEGMLRLMDQWLPLAARIQESWVESGEQVIRYADLLEHDEDILQRVLIEQCGLDVPREKLRAAVVANRFENLTGRPRGQEDLTSHERRGVAGDWRNHFTDRLKRLFKVRYGGLLIVSGVEKDLNW
ncbi:MAG: ATP-binding cassette domain-containing protein [Tepidisphaeraceae bacterium]|jgi:ABC-type polysaccharide/polyol phosphate transport system ATPase subunit